MDYVPGGTLRALYPRDTRLPLGTIAGLCDPGRLGLAICS